VGKCTRKLFVVKREMDETAVRAEYILFHQESLTIEVLGAWLQCRGWGGPVPILPRSKTPGRTRPSLTLQFPQVADVVFNTGSLSPPSLQRCNRRRKKNRV